MCSRQTPGFELQLMGLQLVQWGSSIYSDNTFHTFSLLKVVRWVHDFEWGSFQHGPSSPPTYTVGARESRALILPGFVNL